MNERPAVAPPWCVRFVDVEHARHAAEVLGWWSIGTRVAGEIHAHGREWVEVTIVELPAGWVDTALVVERRPRATDPERTELDEHDIGASTWWDDE